jgi:hypothetical protein
MLIPMVKISRRVSAPSAPHQVEFVSIRRLAMTSSISGNRRPSGRASKFGKPKSVIAFLEPSRSESFAIAATIKMPASSNLAKSSVVSIEVYLYLSEVGEQITHANTEGKELPRYDLSYLLLERFTRCRRTSRQRRLPRKHDRIDTR